MFLLDECSIINVEIAQKPKRALAHFLSKVSVACPDIRAVASSKMVVVLGRANPTDSICTAFICSREVY